MFEKIIVTLILILAAVLVFSGCSTIENKADQIENEIESRFEPIEDAVESKADAVEDAIESKADEIENTIEQALSNALTPSDATASATAATDTVAAEPADPAITNPAQEQIDKVADILGGILSEQATTLHVSDSAHDNAVSSSSEQPVFITTEEAKQIAFTHAGVSEEDTVFVNATREFDDGAWHYDVEFRVGLTEYEYEIHAETGAILSFEKDN